MENIDIIYLYEHVARELDVACAVKCIVEQHFGTRVEIVHFPSGLPRAFRMFRPRVVVLSHCYSARSFPTVLLEWRKSLFFNLAWEQLLSEATQTEKAPSDEFARKHVIHQAWSDSFASFLQNQGVPSKNIVVNGQPAYMLYKEPYRRYFKERQMLAKECSLNVNRRWIFFPENFWRAFYSDDEINLLVEQGANRDQAYAIKEFTRKTMREVMKWCVPIAKHRNVELIIRPRPATPLKDFRNAVQQIIAIIPERMHFIKEDSVREWIMASDVIISSYSTSLIEAAVAGKSTFMLEPYPIPEFLHVDWQNYITRVKTLDEFERFCLNSVSDNNQLANWAQTVLLAHGDPIWNLADFLAKLCGGEIQYPSFPSRNIVTRPGRLPLPRWASYEYRRLRYNKFRRTVVHKDFVRRENDNLDQEVIDRRTKMWEKILTEWDSVNWGKMKFNRPAKLILNKSAHGSA